MTLHGLAEDADLVRSGEGSVTLRSKILRSRVSLTLPTFEGNSLEPVRRRLSRCERPRPRPPRRRTFGVSRFGIDEAWIVHGRERTFALSAPNVLSTISTKAAFEGNPQA